MNDWSVSFVPYFVYLVSPSGYVVACEPWDGWGIYRIEQLARRLSGKRR